MKRWVVTGIGVVMVWAAIGFTSYAVAWQAHKDHAAQVLLQSEHKAMAKIAKESHGAACIVSGTKAGQLSGILSIPALNLTAPVEEGTDDAELNVAVGHDPQSVWPGVDGAAVFLAHDVSYFVHLNELQTGDLITYTTGCNTVKFQVSGTQVVAAGSPVSNTTGPSLVLDTCYPPNALFFTSKRFLVRANEVAAATKGGNLTPGQAAVASNENVNYTSTAPTALQAQGLTLEQNEAPMGTMQLVNSTQAFAQSPGPLNLEAAALEAYFGGLHSGAQKQMAWWAALAPGVAMPPQLDGGYISGHDSPLNVEIVSSGGSPSQVVLTTTVTISGGAAPGTYAETVTLPVHGTVVTIGAWTFK
ncbi:MAG TPA: class D sortase [Acidimicrobiales bacterium]|nr:class D sortase [Acidimicrobiales bacterium]